MANAEQGKNTEVHEVKGWRYLSLRVLAGVIRLWNRSLRIEMSEEDKHFLRTYDKPLVIILWHNEIFTATEIHRRFRSHRRIYGLVSASKDGAWLDAFFKLMGVHTVRGSSSRRSLAATRELLKLSQAGHDIAITPDGPRGPAGVAKPGAAMVAGKTGAGLLLLGCRYESAWRLNSWDRFVLPKLRSRVSASLEYLPQLETLGSFASTEKAASLLEKRLKCLSETESAS